MPELRSTQNRLRDPEVCTRTFGSEDAAQAVGEGWFDFRIAALSIAIQQTI
jgi:hypothetical protein